MDDGWSYDGSVGLRLGRGLRWLAERHYDVDYTINTYSIHLSTGTSDTTMKGDKTTAEPYRGNFEVCFQCA